MIQRKNVYVKEIPFSTSGLNYFPKYSSMLYDISIILSISFNNFKLPQITFGMVWRINKYINKYDTHIH